jgi:hypothetical protein
MDVHCGMEYHISTPNPPQAEFALRYGQYVRYFRRRENAELALKLLPLEDQERAGICRLEKNSDETLPGVESMGSPRNRSYS